MSEKPYPRSEREYYDFELDMTVSDAEPPMFQATHTKNCRTHASAWHPTPFLAAQELLRTARSWHTVEEWVEMMPTGPWHEAAIRTFRHLLPNGGAAMDYRIDELQERFDRMESTIARMQETIDALGGKA